MAVELPHGNLSPNGQTGAQDTPVKTVHSIDELLQKMSRLAELARLQTEELKSQRPHLRPKAKSWWTDDAL